MISTLRFRLVPKRDKLSSLQSYSRLLQAATKLCLRRPRDSSTAPLCSPFPRQGFHQILKSRLNPTPTCRLNLNTTPCSSRPALFTTSNERPLSTQPMASKSTTQKSMRSTETSSTCYKGSISIFKRKPRQTNQSKTKCTKSSCKSRCTRTSC